MIFKLTNRKNLLEGLQVYKNESITILLNNPVDYVIDGLIILNNNKIIREKNEKEPYKTDLMNHKYNDLKLIDKNYICFENNNFNGFYDVFNFIKNNVIFCEFSLSKEDIMYVGKVVDVRENSIDVDLYNTKFTLLDNAYIEYKDITTIKIFTDYTLTFKKFHDTFDI